jgi:hypothetical protein
MAIKEYQWYDYNQATQKEAVANVQDISAALEWMVLCTVPVGQQITVQGFTQDAVYCFLVGQEAAVPGTDSLVETRTVVAGETDYNLVWPAPLWGNYYDMGHGYKGYNTSIGSNLGFVKLSDVDYSYPDLASFQQALEDGDIKPIQNNDVYFDVYINGKDKPSLFVNWTAGEDLSAVLCAPKIWIGTESLIGDNDLIDVEGVRVPNTANWNVSSAGEFAYGASYSTTYLSIMGAFEQFLNPVSKVEMWGFDGEPDFVRLYLRMDYDDKMGELYRVAINKDGTLNSNYKVPNSSTGNYATYVRIHYGEPDYVPPEDDESYPGGKNIDDDGPGRYDPDNRPDPSDFTDPAGFDGNAVLTRTYAVTASTLENIGQKLWTQSYFDVLKIQSNPIENIIAVKQFPFASVTGTTEEIKVGDVAFGINGLKISRMWTHTFGSYTYTGKYKNYLDFAPFTQIKIFLPYCGFVQLDPADLYGSKLSVKYYVDLVTGECMAKIYMDENSTTQKAIPYMSVFGQMGVDIPLTSTDRVQTEMKAISAGLSVFGGAAMQLMGGDVAGAAYSAATGGLSIMGADYTSQRTCTMSPACASYDTQDVFILIKHPAAEYVDPDAKTGFEHLHGRPCNKYLYLSSFSKGSFVQVDKRSDIKIAMTSAENQMLEQLLTSGVYI